MKLKVCGMRETKNIKALASLQPDYMGFIFWEPSKRYCTTVPSDIPKTIKKVGVFVDEDGNRLRQDRMECNDRCHFYPDWIDSLYRHCPQVERYIASQKQEEYISPFDGKSK